MSLKKWKEGKAQIFVPERSLLRKLERYPAFYNPRGALTRDVSVGIARKLGKNVNFLDAMCGVGVRGIRACVEADVKRVVLNDVNPEAIALAYLNAKENGILDKVELQSQGCNALCALEDFKKGYEFVDVDPFGSVAPFTHNALLATRDCGILGVCSTDGANLCGNRPHALHRLYFAFNKNKLGKKESALRILMGFVIRSAAVLGFAAKPVLCYVFADYFRCHFLVKRSQKEAEALTRKIGYTLSCEHAHYSSEPVCEVCGARAVSGPLWTGELCDKEFVTQVLSEITKLDFVQKQTKKLLLLLSEECSITQSFVDLHALVKGLGLGTPKIEKVLEQLKSNGFKATRTHFSPTGVRTDAPLKHMVQACKS